MTPGLIIHLLSWITLISNPLLWVTFIPRVALVDPRLISKPRELELVSLCPRTLLKRKWMQDQWQVTRTDSQPRNRRFIFKIFPSSLNRFRMIIRSIEPSLSKSQRLFLRSRSSRKWLPWGHSLQPTGKMASTLELSWSWTRLLALSYRPQARRTTSFCRFWIMVLKELPYHPKPSRMPW